MKKFMAAFLAALITISCMGISVSAADYFVEYGFDITETENASGKPVTVKDPATGETWHTQTTTVKPGDTVSFYERNKPGTLSNTIAVGVSYFPGSVADTVNNLTYQAHSKEHYDTVPVDEGGTGVEAAFSDKNVKRNLVTIKNINDTVDTLKLTYGNGDSPVTEQDATLDYVVDHGVFDCWAITLKPTENATNRVRVISLTAQWVEDPDDPFPVPVDDRTPSEKLKDAILSFIMNKILGPILTEYGDDIAHLTPVVMNLVEVIQDWFDALEEYFAGLKGEEPVEPEEPVETTAVAA